MGLEVVQTEKLSTFRFVAGGDGYGAKYVGRELFLESC